MRTIVWVLVLSCLPAAASDVRARLDSIFVPLADENTPGVAVLVQHDGKTLYQRTVGVRDLRTRARIDGRTNFRLASVSKQFTAMAVMLLAREGKLRYDDSLRRFFPDFPAYGQDITVRHLLHHTSGVPDYEELMAPVERATGRAWTPERQIEDSEVLELLKQQSRGKFAPGTGWAYSNSGYVLLGLMVARVSGLPFDHFLQERIFGPLKMKDTLAFVDGRNAPAHRAYGHVKQPARFVERDQSATSATLGDGGIYSNLVDLAKWDEALERGTLLGAAEMRVALEAAKLRDGATATWPLAQGEDNLDPGRPVAYGFGWFVDPLEGRARMWHSGSTTGFRTVIQRLTDDKLTVIVLCNRTDLDATALALRAAGVVRRRMR